MRVSVTWNQFILFLIHLHCFVITLLSTPSLTLNEWHLTVIILISPLPPSMNLKIVFTRCNKSKLSLCLQIWEWNQIHRRLQLYKYWATGAQFLPTKEHLHYKLCHYKWIFMRKTSPKYNANWNQWDEYQLLFFAFSILQVFFKYIFIFFEKYCLILVNIFKDGGKLWCRSIPTTHLSVMSLMTQSCVTKVSRQ